LHSHGLTHMLVNKSRSGKIRVRETHEVVRRLNTILTEVLPLIYSYNSMIRNTNYYLKPVHMVSRRLPSGAVVKYYYYGRYWYRVEKNNGRIKWIYLGRSKPSMDLPDPPENPLEGLVVKKIEGGDLIEIVFASEDLFRRLYDKLFSRSTSA